MIEFPKTISQELVFRLFQPESAYAVPLLLSLPNEVVDDAARVHSIRELVKVGKEKTHQKFSLPKDNASGKITPSGDVTLIKEYPTQAGTEHEVILYQRLDRGRRERFVMAFAPEAVGLQWKNIVSSDHKIIKIPNSPDEEYEILLDFDKTFSLEITHFGKREHRTLAYSGGGRRVVVEQSGLCIVRPFQFL